MFRTLIEKTNKNEPQIYPYVCRIIQAYIFPATKPELRWVRFNAALG